MAGEDSPQRVRLDATSLGSPEIAPGSEISASGIVASVDADGRVITVGRARVTLDRKEIPLRGQTLLVVTQETLASAFKRNVAKLAWAVSAGICASLLLALLVAADYNDLFDLEPRYWELLLKVIAVLAGLWFLYSVVRARGLKTPNRVAEEFVEEVAPAAEQADPAR